MPERLIECSGIRIQISVGHEDLARLVDEVLVILGPAAAARKIKFCTHHAEAQLECLVDRERIRQVLLNVVGNAVKFIHSGGDVTVTSSSDGNAAVIEVSDNGIGIHSSFLPHLFDRFRQADMSPAREFGGLGVGLTRSASKRPRPCALLR